MGVSDTTRMVGSFDHITLKTLISFDNLQKAEDAHFGLMLRTGAELLLFSTLGAYFSAKSALFQDRWTSLIIAGVLIFMVSNAPSYFYTHRIALAYGSYFFLGTGCATILWYNLGMDIWTVIRLFLGLAISSYAYNLPNQGRAMTRRVYAKLSESSVKRIDDVNRLWFFAAGPLATFIALTLTEYPIKYILSTSFLPFDMVLKITAGVSVWNFITGQYVFVKCCLFDRDAIWHNYQMFTEMLLSLYFVPRSLFVKSDED